MNKRRTQVKDIALKAGVSPATVSRALSNKGLVAEPTLSRVLEAARQLNYRPNKAARSLRTQKSMVILLVVRDISNPFYLDIFKGVETVAQEAGYTVLMCNTENQPEREASYCSMLRDGYADGMIVMTGRYPSGFAKEKSQLNQFPTVVCLEIIESNPLPSIQIDNRKAAQEATEHLIRLGHKRIAHICGPVPEIMSVLRREGYRDAMAQARLPIPEGYEPIGDFTVTKGAYLCRQIFSSLPIPPTALFVASDTMAFGAICELYRLGFRVPDDISVIGFDDLEFGKSFFPPLTTIRQPCNAIGCRAMTLLLDVMAGKAHSNTVIEFPTELILRQSTAPVADQITYFHETSAHL